VVPLSQLKSTFPVLKTVGRKKAAGFTLEQWRTRSPTPSPRRNPGRCISATTFRSVRVLWASALATLEPGHQDTFVNYDNDDRAPLLFISGGEDHLMPPSVQRSNAKHYKSNTVTEVKEYPGYAHLLPAQNGWEQIADDALSWAVEHAR
jgi:pimeloyl-ACP methyl ester carboxylesterase